MVTKEDHERKINQMLGTDIEWSRLLEEDIEDFRHMIETGEVIESMAKAQAKEKGTKLLEKGIDEWKPGEIAGRLI